VELTVAFAPSPRLTEDQYVSVTQTVNSHSTHAPVSQSPWKSGFTAETGDTIWVTGRQNAAFGTISCRIQVDGQQRDHDVTGTGELQISCMEVL